MFHYIVNSERIVSSWRTLDEFATPVTKEQGHLIAFHKSPFEDQNNAESDTDLLLRQLKWAPDVWDMRMLQTTYIHM